MVTMSLFLYSFFSIQFDHQNCVSFFLSSFSFFSFLSFSLFFSFPFFLFFLFALSTYDGFLKVICDCHVNVVVIQTTGDSDLREREGKKKLTLSFPSLFFSLSFLSLSLFKTWTLLLNFLSSLSTKKGRREGWTPLFSPTISFRLGALCIFSLSPLFRLFFRKFRTFPQKIFSRSLY